MTSTIFSVSNVFQFVRVEDIAYDKRPGMGNIVYIADSGRGRRVDQGLDTPNFKSTNGGVALVVIVRRTSRPLVASK